MIKLYVPSNAYKWKNKVEKKKMEGVGRMGDEADR